MCHQEANTFLSRHPATCPSRVRPGRTFVARMYRTAAKDKELTFYIKLNNEFRLDLFWWHYFLKHWNGLSLLCSDQYGSLVDRCIQTDASRIWGCGSTWDNQWFLWPWAEEWREVNIMVKELVPIVISCMVWAPHLTKHRVPFQCDNMSLVRAIQKGNSKEPVIMYLMHSLWFLWPYHDTDLVINHIAVMNNCAADMLSRNNMSESFMSFPQISWLPTVCRYLSVNC